MFKKHPIWMSALIIGFISVSYWTFWASDRYVSEAHIIIQKTDLASGQVPDLGSLISGSAGVNRADQVLLRDYLLSVDMLKQLDQALKLRQHFSHSQHDWLSRMWFEDASIEWFHRHYLNRVLVEFDEYAGVLVIKAQAYDAEMAHAISQFLVQQGEVFMNRMAQSLASDQVSFLEKQVESMKQNALTARQALLAYQNDAGLLSPQATAEAIAQMIAKLEAQKTELETQRSSLASYLVPNHASITQLNQQIAAIDKQIVQEQRRLTSPKGDTLNTSVERFQRLEMEATFAQEIYQSALIALEKGRVEATRNIKKVSIIQTATLPEYPWEPRRAYNSLVSLLLILVFSSILQLILAIIKDHKD